MPMSYQFNLYRGDTKRWRFLFWNDAAKTDAADLTGVTALSEIRDKTDGATIVIPLTCTVTLPNIVDVFLSADNSAMLPAKGGVWDLQLTYLSGDVMSPVCGAVSVRADVTQPTIP